MGGDRPSTIDEAEYHKAKYMAWLSSLGAAAISPANPLNQTMTINPDGSVVEGGKSAMCGYSIIEADSMVAALELAKGCPFHEIGGTLEASDLMKMPS